MSCICSVCGNEAEKLWVRRPSICMRNSCKQAYYRNKAIATGESDVKRSPIKKHVPRPTGELVLFESLWQIRPHVCEVTGSPIRNFNIWCFAHVLPKSTHSKFRLYERNIRIVLPEIHDVIDKQSQKKLLEYPGGQRWLDLKEELKIEYKNHETKSICRD